MNGMATAADWMSAASFISMAGLIAFTGYDNSTYLMGWTGGYVLLAMLLRPICASSASSPCPNSSATASIRGPRAHHRRGLPADHLDHLCHRSDGAWASPLPAILEVSETGLWIGAAVVFAYAVLGGMKGITYTQVAQYIVLIVAYTIPAVFISLALTGNFLPQLGLFRDA